MDQNQTVDNDLQKAIDDITNTTNADPVFSDPVAAPSSVPEGDTGELAEAIGPFPTAEPEPAPAQTVEMVAPTPEPLAPIEDIVVPELQAPAEEPAPEPAPLLAVETPPAPEPMPAFEPLPVVDNTPERDTKQVKQAALRDLIPLIDHLNMNAPQKFNFYRNIFDDLHDYTVLDPAYRAAKEIPDDAERAKALLYLVESIDKM